MFRHVTTLYKNGNNIKLAVWTPPVIYSVALKRAVWDNEGLQPSTWSWCTWSQPWFLPTRRVWPIHQAAGGGQPFGSHEMWLWTVCCSGPTGRLLLKFVQRYHSRTSSWLTLPLTKFQCPGAPASGLCRCRWNRSASSSSCASCHQRGTPTSSRPSSRLCWTLLAAYWQMYDEISNFGFSQRKFCYT